MCQLLQLTTQQSGDEELNVENFQLDTSDEHSNVKYDRHLFTKDLNVKKFSAEQNKHAVINLNNKVVLEKTRFLFCNICLKKSEK